MSVHGDDPVDETTPVFTQWKDGVPDSAVDDIDAAIRAVLSAS